MSTLGRILSEGLEKTRFTKPGCRKYRPRFRLVLTLLEMSVAKQVQKNKHMLKSRARFGLEQVGEAPEAVRVLSKKPSFRSYNSPMDTHALDNSK